MQLITKIYIIIHDYDRHLLYKDEKPSVHLSIRTFFGIHLAPWFPL